MALTPQAKNFMFMPAGFLQGKEQPAGDKEMVTSDKQRKLSYDRLSRWYDWLAGSEHPQIQASIEALGWEDRERV